MFPKTAGNPGDQITTTRRNHDSFGSAVASAGGQLGASSPSHKADDLKRQASFKAENFQDLVLKHQNPGRGGSPLSDSNKRSKILFDVDGAD